MSKDWDNQLKNAQERFKNHKAKLVADTEDFTIIDWRNADGRSDYYVNFFVDKRRGSLHVDGDLGSSIATWYNRLKVSDLKSYIYNDVGYYMGKFQCTSDDYIYDEDDVFEELVGYLEKDNIEEYIETSGDFDDYDDFEETVRSEIANSIHDRRTFIPTERLYEIVTDIDDGAWEYISSCGKRVDGRVYLWAIGFYMAVEQLEKGAIL
jgi:hypothetical protein